MSEYVFAYLLAHERLILPSERRRQRGGGTDAADAVARKQIGLLGVGTIGAALARTAKHFGWRCTDTPGSARTVATSTESFHGSLTDVGPRSPGISIIWSA